MKIIFSDSFVNRLENQVDNIAQDSPARARNFKNDLIKRIKQINKNPYQFRQFIYFNDKNIRDLIFKGYTIVFQIKPDIIEVFGFVKFQDSPF